MDQLRKTVFYDRHFQLGAKIVDFAGWEMPIQYSKGIVHEHLATRKTAGLFDVSHMGRFVFRGDSLPFLQHVLSNNAAALDVGQSQYTFIPNETGGAIDDAYLYRFTEDEYLLVVNASNRQKDWEHFESLIGDFESVEMSDRTEDIVMLSVQGPKSKQIVSSLIEAGPLPEPMRNRLSTVTINSKEVLVARTGYTGEPVCFELFIDAANGPEIWDLLTEAGAEPIGLGARDTLRLEAGLPLYGHELGKDKYEREIPIFACELAKFAVSFSSLKGNFVGRDALSKQFAAFRKIKDGDYSLLEYLPQMIRPVAVSGKGIARQGSGVFTDGKEAGYVTSGTMVPYYKYVGEGLFSEMTEEKKMRSVCLALVDSDIADGDRLEIEIRGKKTDAVVVPYHLRGEAPPYARPIVYDNLFKEKESARVSDDLPAKALTLLNKTVDNTRWRQSECINLIPSEQTQSSMSRLISIMDPSGRYAEHKAVKAFSEAEVFYYQGTDFIAEVERLLAEQMQIYLGCMEIEARVISGQMANAAVFSSLVDYLNRSNRKIEPRRISRVLNHHIIKGGHLSAQPMGALHDFVAHDPTTERAAVVNFPVLPDNPYKVDVAACQDVLAEYKPELIILGKSLVLHREPVAEIRSMVDEMSLDCVVMYDMAHVLGLVGPYFQEPFKEGADIVTASTHKTFFGTQRGIIASNFHRDDHKWPLWETVCRRAFPGSVSNHHLGTLLGLLMAAYEMNHFKDEYQKKVIANAKAFALALKNTGLDVAGDAGIDYTETHQVVLNVGYSKGPQIARLLEDNNIIVNYQASPEEEGFTAAGCLRMGVAEMTRFGMQEKDFQQLAQLICDLVNGTKSVKEEVTAFRKRFTNMRYCFSGEEFTPVMEKLYQLI
ncbi:MAG: glycine cleavage system aminomethyltransferase GcvT [Planctomycetes bacterium]|nr:glycine cleavage system aminomethyltransferase GcvT [Planctomycetota bacterium]